MQRKYEHVKYKWYESRLREELVNKENKKLKEEIERLKRKYEYNDEHDNKKRKIN